MVSVMNKKACVTRVKGAMKTLAKDEVRNLSRSQRIQGLVGRRVWVLFKVFGKMELRASNQRRDMTQFITQCSRWLLCGQRIIAE